MRIFLWFSRGAASAVAFKKAHKKYGNKLEAFYNDVSQDEHPDGARFQSDIENWVGAKVKSLRNPDYKDIFDVFEKIGYLVDIKGGTRGAPCTGLLKRQMRNEIAFMDDIQILGYTADPRELKRRENAQKSEPETHFEFILGDLTKADCFDILKKAGIELPWMYRHGYPNNNCMGCVKVESIPYWQHIRQDFPERFERMAIMERKLGFALNRVGSGDKRKPIFLDELPAGVRPMRNVLDAECGIVCQSGNQ